MSWKDYFMNNAIVIGGLGIVGQATRHALAIKDYYDFKGSTVKKENITDFKYIFICLPTPTIGGNCYINDIIIFIAGLNSKKDNVFIIRSTVIPGTCKKIIKRTGATVVHVPEFLTMSTWEKDAEWPDIVVIGGEDKKSRDEIVGIYKSRYKGSEFIITDTITAEVIKYAINTFYAQKVVFANQLYDFCSEVGGNYETIRKAMYARKWIGGQHLTVWYNKDKKQRGAGGGCLAKDLEAFAKFTKLPLLLKVFELNAEYLSGKKD